jgi:glutathione synthase/RimK-type ligase-like ATP-grasp enzyme
MKRIAFVTSEALVELIPGDKLLAEAFLEAGIRVVPAIWDDPSVRWDRFDLILLRSPWDYYKKAEAFLEWLSVLERENAFVLNPISLVRWNLQKNYLATLSAQGVPIVPTVFIERGQVLSLSSMLEEKAWETAIIKPQISAGAFETWTCTKQGATPQQKKFEEATLVRPTMVQPLIPEVTQKGEWSLMFFGDKFSHAVVKRAAAGDFRVQSEFGGSVQHQSPSEPLMEVASHAIKVASQVSPWLYARVDLVETAGGPLLMELEMIEPELFFEYEAGSAERFVTSLFDSAAKYK